MSLEGALNTLETLPGLTRKISRYQYAGLKFLLRLQTTGRLKRCIACNGENGPAAKRCRTCGEVIVRKEPEDIEDQISKMGKTNPTKQFNMLKKRAKILNIHHGWDIVVMACHSHGRGTSFATFGTAGLGQDFIGEAKSRSVTGKAVVDLFSSFANQNSCKKLPAQTDEQEINLKATKSSTEMLSDPPPTSTNQASTSTNQPSTSTNQPSTSTDQPSTSTNQPSTSTDQPSTSTNQPSISTNQPSTSTNQPSTSTNQPSTSTNQPSTSTNQPSTSTNQPSISTNQPSTSTNQISTSTNQTSTIAVPLSTSVDPPSASADQPSTIADPPSGAVVLLDNGTVVEVGKTTPLDSIHGVPLPQHHHCVALSWAQEKYPAPCPLGRRDLEENLFLHKDMFYAIPNSMLKRFVKNNDEYVLLPFS